MNHFQIQAGMLHVTIHKLLQFILFVEWYSCQTSILL